jgi:hypothetical protein
MSRSVVYLLLLVALLNGLLFSSCKKDENTYRSYNPSIDAAHDYVIGQQMMVLILNTYYKSITDSLLLTTGRSNIDGAAVYLQEWNPDTLLIRYPSWGAHDGYGHWRAGEIKVCVDQGFLIPAAINQFCFVDFQYDKDTLRVDSLYVQYVGVVNAQSERFRVYSDTIRQVFSDSSGVNKFWMQQSFLMFKDTASDFHKLLNTFEISGVFQGIARGGVSYSTNTPEEPALLNQLDCSFLKQGPVSITFTDTTNTGLVYFSEADSCSNQYIFEFDGNPFPAPIYVRKW